MLQNDKLAKLTPEYIRHVAQQLSGQSVDMPTVYEDPAYEPDAVTWIADLLKRDQERSMNGRYVPSRDAYALLAKQEQFSDSYKHIIRILDESRIWMSRTEINQRLQGIENNTLSYYMDNLEKWEIVVKKKDRRKVYNRHMWVNIWRLA